MNFKNILTNIKTANYKEFFVNHVEKFLVGFAVLFVAYCLYATNWSFEKRHPQTLLNQAQEAKEKFLQTNWTPEERAKFEANSNLDSKIQQILYPIAVHKYGFSTDMDWPIFEERKPAVEPQFLAVRGLQANGGRTLLDLIDLNKVEQIEKDSATIATTNEEKFSDSDKEMMERYGITPEQLKRAEDAEKMAREGNTGAPGSRGRNFATNTPSGRDGDRDARREERRSSRRELGNLVRQNSSISEPHRFVSITGVFPVRQQKLELLKAMNSTSMARTVMNIDSLFYDFKIERQIAQPGKDPWSGDWQEVSRPVTENILRRSAGFAPESVNQFVTNNIFTMPLPSRSRGSWGRYASHPLVENYVLSPEEIEQQLKIVSDMVDTELARMRAQEEAKEDRGGFSNFVYNVNQFQNNSTSDSFLDSLLKDSQDDRNQKIIEKLKETATAESNLLLFRFLDFSVEPGQIYRYRVKLVFHNPNYQKELYKVASPEIAEGKFRESPWSNPTLPVAVVDDLQYYIAKDPVEVQGRWGTSVQAYQWLEKFGTLINERINLKLGDFVMDYQKRTEVVKPSEQTVSKENADFTSHEMLLALEAPIELDPEIHSDLQLPNSTGRDLPGMPSIGVFTTPTGVLKVKDNIGEKNIESQLENTVKFERLTYNQSSAINDDLSSSRNDDDDDRDSRRERRREFNPTQRFGGKRN
ncbi:MAG: hypothetical protein KDA65_09060 [Planctomycetaceae bacterium]|nr:hypothetical protein [Planctomycetaceae bacterium]